ncbi:MAG: asparagine synthase C-terminal domain-containing protein [Candidatus Micrarchaeota archaeon]
MGEIGEAISESVKACVSGKEIGVMFSGGLDSALVAFLSKQYAETNGYTVGVDGSQDLKWARVVAKEMGIELVESVLGEEEILDAYEEVRKLLGVDDMLSIELGIPVLLCSEMAREGGIGRLLCGHGADELFGGYHKYPEMFRDGEDVRSVMERDLKKVLEVDVPRSRRIAGKAGVEMMFPFLEKGVVESSNDVELDEHFSGDERKPVLRKIARKLGVPESACSRPKKALQYGSGIHKVLAKIRPNHMDNI